MSKLHEVLAVEGELEGAYKQKAQEVAHLFGERNDMFQGHERVYSSFLDESERDTVPTDHHEMSATVNACLDGLFGAMGRYYDAVLQKDTANQAAKADIVIGDQVIAEGVPATTLLGLETKMKLVRDVLKRMPTLQPGIKWEEDKDLGENVYRQVNPEETMRTRKQAKYVTVAEATQHHPAQVEKEMEELQIGKFVKTIWSGMLTPARKTAILRNIDMLSTAIKQARQRANCAEIEKVTIGQKLSDFILR